MPRRARPLVIAAALVAACIAVAVAVFALHPRGTAVAEDDVPAVTRATPINARIVATSAPRAAAAPAETYGLLDGAGMTAEENRRRAAQLPVAVMVDNWLDARPQYGLDRAEIVYEALVEYGITRFMAVYWRNDAEVIEPVRSARTQFLPLALELGAVYAHVGAAAEGGPADATSQMREWGVHEVDEVEGETVIKRDPKRQAPHNAYTSTDALRAHARQKGWNGPATVVPWPFKADGGTAAPALNAVEMDFDVTGTHKGAFTVRWEYDAATNRYLRSQAGAPHVDARSEAQLAAKNVIIQVAVVKTDVDRDRHVLYDLEGTGKALVLLDGRAITATWQKDSRTGRTRYLDAEGREIPLNRGTTWVELLPAGQPLTAW
jgi:hypothetical protein